MIQRAMQCVVLSAMSLLAAGAFAQSYPVKPVRYIMPSTGASELVGRLIAQGMSEVLGQQVYVDLRTGAGGNLGADIAAKAPADGYTLLAASVSTHSFAPAVSQKLSYDPVKDLAPVALMTETPLVLFVRPSFPAKNLAEYLAWMKANPINDMFVKNGRIREDGRMMREMYLFEVIRTCQRELASRIELMIYFLRINHLYKMLPYLYNIFI